MYFGEYVIKIFSIKCFVIYMKLLTTLQLKYDKRFIKKFLKEKKSFNTRKSFFVIRINLSFLFPRNYFRSTYKFYFSFLLFLNLLILSQCLE